ncbi:MAG: T9SS type A sorting domain-containing protein [Bacteroidota bacterium]|nr:T9SS type A sorting domain-containing protein [Bacteroidota bacterium]
MKKFAILLIWVYSLLVNGLLFAQNRNSVWIFGDSTGINFSNINSPIPIFSAMDSRGSSCSISDTAGSLLFYASGSDPLQSLVNETVKVRNNLNQIIANGDSIIGRIWYQELTITDNPTTYKQFYLFSIGVTSSDGFYYSVIDMNANGGLGSVTQKNIQLETFKVVDGMIAIKHGNGRDWWVLLRNADIYSNNHYVYLITQGSVSSPIIQAVGSDNNTNSGRYTISNDGSKLSYINFKGLLEIYDFDRCTGLISNPVTIHPEPPSSPYFNRFWSSEFSFNKRFIYISTYSNDTSFLYQYDLLNPNPGSSRILLDSTTNSLIGFGFLRRGPNEKIYFSKAYQCSIFPYCYPYPDSVYNIYNMNLSVINHPDSLGTACNYAPYSFYLGGKRTYYSLPNNPDYDLSALNGSPCDSLSSISETNAFSEAELFIYYTSDLQTAFINANRLKGKNYYLEVFDLLGKSIIKESGNIFPPHFTKNLNCSSFSNGMYIVNLVTDKERLVKRFVVR